MVKCKEIGHTEWNNFITEYRTFGVFVNKKYDKNSCYLKGRCYVWEARSFAYLRANYRGTTVYYKTSLTENKDGEYIGAGSIALRQLSATLDDEAKEILHQFDNVKPLFSAGSILWFNPKYNLTRIEHAIGYDLNSAFSAAMIQPMPDTRVDFGPGYVEKGQIGFTTNIEFEIGLDDYLTTQFLRREGSYAQHRFKLIESPYKKFVDSYYEKKKNPKDVNEKIKAKSMLNYSIGAIQNHNFYIRAAILEYCNEFMYNLINKYRDIILFSNTDSIVATEPIPEIEANLGNGLGQWKIEHEGPFSLKYLSYQWHTEDKITYRGIPTAWFDNFEKNYGRKFDLLKDEIPKFGNNYYLDLKDRLIKEAENE